MKKLISALAGALLLAALVAPAGVTAASKYSPDIWVSQSGTPAAGWGTSCSHPDFDTIAGAVDNGGTHVGDVIHICPGIWYEYGIYSEHDNIVLEGEGPSKTIIDPDGDGRFFSTYEEGGGDYWFNDVTLRGMTIRNSRAIYGHGGAIEAGNVNCRNVDFIDNFADEDGDDGDGGAGGAIIAWGSYVGNGCRFIDNYAEENGGALWVQYNVTSTNEYYLENWTDGAGGHVYHRGYDQGSATFTGAKFQAYCCDYDATDGGAIYNNDGNLTVSKSQFINLSVQYDGGAIYSNTDNTVRLTNNKFVSMYADSDGGAFYGGNLDQDEYFVGNEFSDNSADVAGGAVYSDSNDSFFRSNLFAYNYSYGNDGDAVWFTDCGGEMNMLGGKWYGMGTKSFNGSNKYTYWDGGKVNVTSWWPGDDLVDGTGC